MIEIMKATMIYHLNQNKSYVTKEGQEWANNELQKVQVEINYETDKCHKELSEK